MNNLGLNFNVLEDFFWLPQVFVTVHGFLQLCRMESTPLAAGHEHLIVVASLVTKHRLQGSWAQISYSEECGIFPDQESNPHPLHQRLDCQPLDHQRSLLEDFFFKAGSLKYNLNVREGSVLAKWKTRIQNLIHRRQLRFCLIQRWFFVYLLLSISVYDIL